jgi:hypothetical protein
VPHIIPDVTPRKNKKVQSVRGVLYAGVFRYITKVFALDYMKFEASNRKFKEFLVVSGGVSILFRHVIVVAVKIT